MHQQGIHIPGDMRVICFDEVDAFSFANIPVTYIKQPIQQIGEKAIEALFDQIRGSDQAEHIVLNSEIKFSL
jgi:LacI family transcriptional regulator